MAASHFADKSPCWPPHPTAYATHTHRRTGTPPKKNKRLTRKESISPVRLRKYQKLVSTPEPDANKTQKKRARRTGADGPARGTTIKLDKHPQQQQQRQQQESNSAGVDDPSGLLRARLPICISSTGVGAQPRLQRLHFLRRDILRAGRFSSGEDFVRRKFRDSSLPRPRAGGRHPSLN